MLTEIPYYCTYWQLFKSYDPCWPTVFTQLSSQPCCFVNNVPAWFNGIRITIKRLNHSDFYYSLKILRYHYVWPSSVSSFDMKKRDLVNGIPSHLNWFLTSRKVTVSMKPSKQNLLVTLLRAGLTTECTLILIDHRTGLGSIEANREFNIFCFWQDQLFILDTPWIDNERTTINKKLGRARDHSHAGSIGLQFFHIQGMLQIDDTNYVKIIMVAWPFGRKKCGILNPSRESDTHFQWLFLRFEWYLLILRLKTQ